MNWNRLISGLIAGTYIVFAFTHLGFAQATKACIGLILPLFCIWFPEAMGGYVGRTTSVAITSPSPGWLVLILGWLLLLMPLIMWITLHH